MSWKANFKRKVNAILKKAGMAGSPERTELAAQIAEEVVEVLHEAGVEQTDRREVEVDGQVFSVPYLVFFARGSEKAGYYFFEVVGYRQPKKGECYIEGHMTEVFTAGNNVCGNHLIVERTYPAKKHHVWRKDAQNKEDQEG